MIELPWTFGLIDASLVVGVVLRNYFYARAIPQGTKLGRLRDSLALRGWIVARQDGGCDLRLVIRPPYLFRRVFAALAGILIAVCLAAFAQTTTVGFLLAAALLVTMVLSSAFARRAYGGNELREWALLEAWMNEVVADLQRGFAHDP